MSSRISLMPVQTATWPKGNKLYMKMTKRTEKDSLRRPTTATLDKPSVLDPKFLRKLDMTTLSKDKLMTIQNLIIPSKARLPKKLPGQSSWEDEDGSAVDEPKVKRFSKGLNTTYRIKSHVRKGLAELFPAAVNVSKLKLQEKVVQNTSDRMKEKKKNITKTGYKVSKQPSDPVIREVIPPPCCTCGRPEQPERLHSHPANWQERKAKTPRPSCEQENRIETQPKSSVRKPNPIKYRSSHKAVTPITSEHKHAPIIRKETFKIDLKKADVKIPPKRKISHIPVIQRSPSAMSPVPGKTGSPVHDLPAQEKRSPVPSPTKEERPGSSPRRPRTVVCYICMREFGTASLPLHEPHCLQRWERENATLPRSMQRTRPKKPNRPLTPDEWNEFAYSTAQASLLPCEKCGRTFQSDRLPVHLKACIGSKMPVTQAANAKTQQTVIRKKPCSLCGHLVLSDVLPSHELACQKKFLCQKNASENDRHPLHLRRQLTARPEPVPSEGQCAPALSQCTRPPASPASHATSTTSTHSAAASLGRRMSICYLCGREFGSASIRIHEPQCLKKWVIENEKLPTEQRRNLPTKPDIVYTEDGIIDTAATDESFWKSHLTQLVPCQKCGRKFNPDRVAVHEKACKGVQHMKLV